MQWLVASSVDISGPTNLDLVLPIPPRRQAYFGEGGLPEALEKAKNDFYRDECVLAFPAVKSDFRIPDIDEKALYVRAPYSSAPGTKPFLPAPADFPSAPAGAVIERGKILNLTSQLGSEGRLQWQVPAGDWTVMRFGRVSTGANTRPAPVPGLGLESDKFDKKALDAHFDAFVGKLLAELGPRKKGVGWTSLHIDSWEMGAQNWSADFARQFRHRRGYDPFPFLPALTGRVVGSTEISERFLWDLRQTAQELVIENHASHLKTLSHRQGFKLSIEPYDMNPTSDMNLGGVADVPMCEFWLYGFNSTFSVIEAASIAHTRGKTIVAAESFTSSDEERWQGYPGAMKSLGDWAFCAGVNRILFHRYQHQPWPNLRPGMTMGPYGVHYERTQTWWEESKAFHEYLARCQNLLRQGMPVADICYLVAEGAPHVFRPPPTATRGYPPDRLGYNFDGCAADTLINDMAVKNGRLVLPDGMSYRVLVLPERDTMTPKLLNKVASLAKAGAVVIGPPHRKSPSLASYPDCDQQVAALSRELWGTVDPTQPAPIDRAVGKGRVLRPPASGAGPEKSTPSPLAHAKWIWFPEGKPAESAPISTRHFKRAIVLAPNRTLASAAIHITADNSFAVNLEGRSLGGGDNFHQVYDFDLTGHLKPGTNWLYITAVNGGDNPNPAGLIAAITLAFQDGQAGEIVTDGSWLSSGEEAADVPWGPVLVLGPFDMAPWNLAARPAPETPQYAPYDLTTAVLREMGVPPDFDSDSTVRYTHRRTSGADIYFVSNPDDRPVGTRCAFRVTGRQPELWDPLTGKVRDLPGFSFFSREITVIDLQFAPHQSFFVIFRKSASGTGTGDNFPAISHVMDIPGPWGVGFDPAWGGPAKITFDQLQDWSQHVEDGIKFYSGHAIYHRSFTPPPDVKPGARLWLDLGKVCNLARVRVNGTDLGILWTAPWQVDITDHIKPGANDLQIEVVNLWPNRLIGDENQPADAEYSPGGNLKQWPDWLLKGEPRPSTSRYTFTTWKHWSKDSPLLPSGLLGPVRILQSNATPNTGQRPGKESPSPEG